MVERVVVGVAESDAVVIAVAVEERHDPGPVGEPEAERLLEEALGRVDRVAVEDDMGEPDRPVLRLVRVAVERVAVDDLDPPAVGVADQDAGAARGIVERLGAVQRPCRRRRSSQPRSSPANRHRARAG